MKLVTIIFPNSLPQIDLKSYDLFVIFVDSCFLDNVEISGAKGKNLENKLNFSMAATIVQLT